MIDGQYELALEFRLSGVTSAAPTPAPLPTLSQAGDVGAVQIHSASWAQTGICLGSPGCLCGQGELSDFGVWNEAD